MAAHKPWREIRRKRPVNEAAIATEKRRLRQEMTLRELRRARELTQQALAESLGETQPSVSQLERQADMYVSTLRRYIEAMGGALDIVARFADGEVRITQFSESVPAGR